MRSYEESTGPADSQGLYKKSLLGTAGGIQVSYNIDRRSAVTAAYTRTNNKGRKNYGTDFSQTQVYIKDFNLRHMNDFFQIGYERSFSVSNPLFRYHAGLVLVNSQQQVISIHSWGSGISIVEHNQWGLSQSEAGVFGGIQFSKKVDTNFEAGIKLRGYFLVSTGTFEAITLTPTLAYNF